MKIDIMCTNDVWKMDTKHSLCSITFINLPVTCDVCHCSLGCKRDNLFAITIVASGIAFPLMVKDITTQIK